MLAGVTAAGAGGYGEGHRPTMGVMRLTSGFTSLSASAAEGGRPHRVGRRGTYLHGVVRRPPSLRSSKIVPAGCPCWRTGVDSSIRRTRFDASSQTCAVQRRLMPAELVSRRHVVGTRCKARPCPSASPRPVPPGASPAVRARGCRDGGPVRWRRRADNSTENGSGIGPNGHGRGRWPAKPCRPAAERAPGSDACRSDGTVTYIRQPLAHQLQRLVVEHLREGDERLVVLKVDDGARVRVAAPCRRYRSTTTSWTSETVFNFRMRGGRARTVTGRRFPHLPHDVGGAAGEQGGDEDERDDDGDGGHQLHWPFTGC